MLIILDAEPLGNSIAKWLCTRLGGNIREMNEKLKRIHFLYRRSEGAKLYHAQIVDKGEKLLQKPIDDNCMILYKYDLIVIEEGHIV